MPQIKTNQIIQTKQGELTVNLNLTLTINVNKDGKIEISASPDYVPQVPDWEDTELIDFGKSE